MARWKWPEAAAREAQRQRRERRKTSMQLAAIVLLIAIIFIVYMLRIGIPALKRDGQHRQHHHYRAKRRHR